MYVYVLKHLLSDSTEVQRVLFFALVLIICFAIKLSLVYLLSLSNLELLLESFRQLMTFTISSRITFCKYTYCILYCFNTSLLFSVVLVIKIVNIFLLDWIYKLNKVNRISILWY